MSRDQEDVASQPLVIVRRRRNADEAHHGGVWKIAYADFMTAMMAFFLVMWLVNAADKKTIVQVAAYFNPIRLTDRFAAPKGLDDLTETETKPSEQRAKKGFLKEMIDEKQKQEAEQESKENIGEAMDEAAQKSSAAAGGKSSEAQKEQSLFDNPGDMLDKLADEAKASQPTTAGSPSLGTDGDPFDRVQRKSAKPPVSAAKQAPPAEPGKISNVAPLQPGQTSKVPGTEAGRKDGSQPEAAKVPGPDTSKPPVSEVAKPPAPPVASKDAAPRDKDAEAKKIESDISDAISKVSKELPQVEVKSTSEGLLISLLDDAKFGMFEVGSAKPRPELVLVMDKVGEILQGKSGKIVIRGHTDSRGYKSGVYDNWRLSAARAQMAYYMLVRGGLTESRVVAIEGRADRDPKLPSDTTAAPNRRIDILVREEK